MSRRIRNLGWLQYRLRGLRYRWIRSVARPEHTVSTSRFYDLRFKTLTTDRYTRLLSKHGAWEDQLTLAVLAATRDQPGTLMLDIGANVGWYSCVLCTARQGLRVHAFEPDPVTHALLVENFALNGLRDAVAIRAAVSSRSGTAELHQPADDRLRNSLLPIHGAHAGRTVVDTVAIDDHLRGHGLDRETIAFIKLDIEGHEVEALRGAAAALRRTQVLLLEYSPKFFEAFGYRGDELLDLVYAAGLLPNRVRDGALHPVTRDEVLSIQRDANLLWLR